MRTVVCGSRTAPLGAVFTAMEACGWVPSVVLSGGARGADNYGELWASSKSIPVERYPAEWDKHGKAAGFIRNAEMVSKSEAVVAVWDGLSRGTAHSIKLATEAGLRVFVHRFGPELPPAR